MRRRISGIRSERGSEVARKGGREDEEKVWRGRRLPVVLRGQKFSREEAQVNTQPETANARSSRGLCSFELASGFCPL